MAEHTPGPWRIADTDWRIVTAAGGLVVADIRAPLSGCGRDDACLIAAAPDLLAVLKSIISHGIDYPDLESVARAVIAKAEGQ